MSFARNSKRRRQNKGRFSFLFKVLAIAAVLAAMTLGATVFFQLQTVEVAGNSRYAAADVEAASGLQTGDNLFRINKYQIQSDIREKLPYVESVNIVRKLPSTILITVTEWHAVANIQPTEFVSHSEEMDYSDKLTDENWLISVGGKLLEQAPADSTAIRVSGLSAISPRAGTLLAVPQEQQGKLDALLALLEVLEAREVTPLISQADLTAPTQILLRYDERFWIKLPMGGDFDYMIRALQTVLPDWDGYEKGTFDLTRKDYPITFSPEG